MENEMQHYVELLFEGLEIDDRKRRQEICQRFLRKCPTPLAIKRLSKLERQEIMTWDSKMKGFLAAIELGEQVAKSHAEIIGHAYSSIELGRSMVEHFQGAEQESVCIACTDVHNEIIAWQPMFVGGQSECVLYPDRIFSYALRQSAHGIIMIHNHPSGDIHPSEQDLVFTDRLQRGCNLLGLHLLDCMIIGRDSYYSWREEDELV